MTEFRIGSRMVGDNHPTFFIAEISANHDGDLQRAIDLIHLAKESGADCAKFQHFQANQIVSKVGFAQVGKLSHQAGWKEEPYDAFARLSLPHRWTARLAAVCAEVGLEFMSSPYDIGAVEHLNAYVPAYKIGSGDINYPAMLHAIASKGKPVLLGTGASTITEVDYAVERLQDFGVPVCLLQCNTNYTNSLDNYKNIALRVLHQYRLAYSGVILGLSDHTQMLAPVIGAVTLGARVIERHFTDDTSRPGPDHAFAMDGPAFRRMVDEVRCLEQALQARPWKEVMPNERETVILQRRALRAARDLAPGVTLRGDDIVALRPAPEGCYTPMDLSRLIGRRMREHIGAGEHFIEEHF